jgi:hypothetical protein
MRHFARILLAGSVLISTYTASSQSFITYTTTESDVWQKGKTSLKNKPIGDLMVEVDGTEQGTVFRAWGTTFNELYWDAFNLLTSAEQDEIMFRLFAPDGDLRFTHGRVSMNANDYAGPHAVLSIPYEWSAGLWSLLLLDILLVVIVVLLIKRIKANKPITKRMVITPPPPAHQPAIEAIEKIRETRDIESSEALKSYYDSLTEILRNYIEQRFGFNALELTSAEIIARLQQSNDAVALHELREILETADLVKFAKYETSMSEADRSLVMAIDYVNSTKQKPEELPMPEVKVVTVGETQQQRVRTTMIVAVVVLAITSLVLFGWGVKEIYDCFL